MKLIHVDYGLKILLQENQIAVLSVENPKAYAGLLGELWSQTQGGLGGFILSEKDKVRNISKEVECIFNPFSLDCNSKKITNRLYQELLEQAETYLTHESAVLNGTIIEFLDKALGYVPYALEHDLDLDVISLLKLYGVRIEISGDSLLERIVEYFKAISRICNIRIIVFVGLKQYLTEDELQKLYEFVFYEKILLLIIEAGQSKYVDGEKHWLLDRDLCIIET